MRDFHYEMRKLVEERAALTDSPAPILARQIVADLRKVDPELLDGWLHEHADDFIRDLVNFLQRSNRARLRIHGTRDRFAKARKEFEAGDSGALQDWLGSAVYTMVDDKRKPLGKLTRSDLDWVIADYRQREKSNAHERIFAELIRERVPNGTVEQHLTNEDIEEIRGSIGFE